MMLLYDQLVTMMCYFTYKLKRCFGVYFVQEI